jgi:ATP-dependent RNA helicase SUPV3L1/SUV3
MYAIQDKQFKLNEFGQVLFQRDPTNPLPGEVIAVLKKGDSLMGPIVEITTTEIPVSLTDEATALARTQEWLKNYQQTVIGQLVALETAYPAEDESASAQIVRQVYAALGILPRADVDKLIEGLDQDARRDLRAKRVRLGPILISMPDLTKPAAVKLRAVLWALWNDKALPLTLPPDGMVSVVVDVDAIDQQFYRSIGYPVYGKRAIRVDMLDRVISAIYDNADKGVFKAKHEMAEWLGCPIAELYEILTAMGHTKISDPVDAPKADNKTDNVVAVEAKAEDVKTEEAAVEAAPAAEVSSEAPAEVSAADAPAAPVVAVKPELASFRLRRGRAHEEARPHVKRERPAFNKDKKFDKPKGDFKKSDRKDGDKDGKGKSDQKKPFNKGKNDRNKPQDKKFDNRDERIVASASAKVDASASPFAALNKLNVARKD